MSGGYQKNKSQHWSGLVLLVVVVIMVVIYYIWVHDNARYNNLNTAAPTIVFNQNTKAVNSDSELGPLKTYESSDYGFRIRYPTDWQVATSQSGKGEEAIFSVSLAGDKEGVSISVMPETLEGIVRHSISVVEENEIELNGITAQKLVGTNPKDGSFYTVVLVKQGGRLYSLSGSGETFDQVISYFVLLGS